VLCPKHPRLQKQQCPGSLSHEAGCPRCWKSSMVSNHYFLPSCLLNQLPFILLLMEMEKEASPPSLWHRPPVPDQRPRPSPILHRLEVLVTGSGPLQSLPKQPQGPGERCRSHPAKASLLIKPPPAPGMTSFLAGLLSNQFLPNHSSLRRCCHHWRHSICRSIPSDCLTLHFVSGALYS